MENLCSHTAINNDGGAANIRSFFACQEGSNSTDFLWFTGDASHVPLQNAQISAFGLLSNYLETGFTSGTVVTCGYIDISLFMSTLL